MWHTRKQGPFKLSLSEKDLLRFWSKVEKTETCWNWIGCVIRNGYGQWGHSKKVHYAQRVSYFIEHGEYENTLMVLHKCDNRRCVNPSHLFLGTNQDNINDMMSKGRQGKIPGNKTVGELRHNSKLTNDQVKSIREMYSNGVLRSEIAKQFNVTWNCIKAVLNRVTWDHLS